MVPVPMLPTTLGSLTLENPFILAQIIVHSVHWSVQPEVSL